MLQAWTVTCPVCHRFITITQGDKIYRCEHCAADLLVDPTYSSQNPVPFRLIILSIGIPHAAAAPAYSQAVSYAAPAANYSAQPAYHAYAGSQSSINPPLPNQNRQIKIQTQGAAIRMSYGWFKPEYSIVILISFALDWWVLNSIRDGVKIAELTDREVDINYVFLPYLFAAVISGIWSLAHTLNRTVIEFNGACLTVYNEPLPWTNEYYQMKKEEIAGLFFSHQPVKVFNARIGEDFTIKAMLMDGSEIILAQKIPSDGAALFLLKELERLIA